MLDILLLYLNPSWKLVEKNDNHEQKQKFKTDMKLCKKKLAKSWSSRKLQSRDRSSLLFKYYIVCLLFAKYKGE